MIISPDQVAGNSVEPPSPAAGQARSERVSTQSSTASAVEGGAAAASNTPVAPVQRSTDVTFRRDGNGQIYYVVADAKSGQEILEVPPKNLREMSQSIDEFLKNEEAKASAHVEVKA